MGYHNYYAYGEDGFDPAMEIDGVLYCQNQHTNWWSDDPTERRISLRPPVAIQVASVLVEEDYLDATFTILTSTSGQKFGSWEGNIQVGQLLMMVAVAPICDEHRWTWHAIPLGEAHGYLGV